MKKGNRLAFEAESRRIARIEEAIQAACPGQDIDFEEARETRTGADRHGRAVGTVPSP